ncbi:MAG: DUF2924 domain-containing protein [Rhizobiaceae bacterium]|nr:DUF2924 domain-containing protein [Rhizobiaceae bacterium]
MRIEVKIEQEVAALCDLTRDELVERWEAAHGWPPPKGVKRGLLERSAAWHLQAKRFGGWSRFTKQILRASITKKDGAPLRRRAGTVGAAGREAPGKDAFVPKPSPSSGTRLMREWNGRMHLVDVTDRGFVFDGKTYRSLTAIAKRITGVHWSGPRFFGL